MKQENRTLDFPVQPGPGSPARQPAVPYGVRDTSGARAGLTATIHGASQTTSHPLAQTRVRRPTPPPDLSRLLPNETVFAAAWSAVLYLLVIAVPMRYFTCPNGVYTPGYWPYVAPTLVLLLMAGAAGASMVSRFRKD